MLNPAEISHLVMLYLRSEKDLRKTINSLRRSERVPVDIIPLIRPDEIWWVLSWNTVDPSCVRLALKIIVLPT